MKINTRVLLIFSAALIGLSLVSCSKSNSSDTVHLSLAFQLDTTAVQTSAKIAANVTNEEINISWSKIEVVINEIKLRTGNATVSTDTMARFQGSWTLNLLDGSSSPALTDLELAEGNYSFLQIKSQKGLIDTTNVILEGMATIGETQDVNVSIALDLTDVVTLSAPTVLRITEDTHLKATFDASTWFNGINWLDCYDSVTESITSDESAIGSCATVLKTLKSNIKKGGIIEAIATE